MPNRLRQPFDLREFGYPSNLLTLARLILLPVALRAMRRPHGNRQAFIALGAAMLTDALDGPIARRRNEVSPLGKLLDPIADKLYIDGTAVTLSQTRGFPWWVTAALLIRDGAILLGGLLVYRRRSEIVVAHPAGKLTTVALTLAMLLYLADGPRRGKLALYAALVPFAASMIVYMRSFIHAMRHRHEP